MLISFVIINRNNQRYLNNCLNSIYKLPYQNKEIILVDDHSIDRSLVLLKIAPHKIIKHTENLGIAVSRNNGVKESKGELVFIIDSDLEISQLDLIKIVNLFNENKKLIAASGNYYSQDASDGNNILDARRKYIFGKDNKELVYGLNNYTTFSGGLSIVNKKRLGNLEQTGKLFTGGEDILFQLRLINKGFKLAYVPYLKAIHHHKRNIGQTILKARSEAKGNVWLTAELLKDNLNLPQFIYIFTLPALLFIGIITGQVFLIILEFIPNIYLIITKRNIVFIYLFMYEILLNLFQAYYFFTFLVGTEDVSIKIRYLYRGIKCDILGKYYWLKNNI